MYLNAADVLAVWGRPVEDMSPHTHSIKASPNVNFLTWPMRRTLIDLLLTSCMEWRQWKFRLREYRFILRSGGGGGSGGGSASTGYSSRPADLVWRATMLCQEASHSRAISTAVYRPKGLGIDSPYGWRLFWHTSGGIDSRYGRSLFFDTRVP